MSTIDIVRRAWNHQNDKTVSSLDVWWDEGDATRDDGREDPILLEHPLPKSGSTISNQEARKEEEEEEEETTEKEEEEPSSLTGSEEEEEEGHSLLESECYQKMFDETGAQGVIRCALVQKRMGGVGQVHYVVKAMPISEQGGCFPDFCTVREIFVLGTVQHPHILRAVKYSLDLPREVRAYLPEAHGKNLRVWLETHLPRLAWSREQILGLLLDIVYQMILSVGALHEQHIAHLDLKPENWLVFYIQGKLWICLSDFALSADDYGSHLVPFGTFSRHAMMGIGTSGYQPLEILNVYVAPTSEQTSLNERKKRIASCRVYLEQHGKFTPSLRSIDIWALGICIVEVLASMLPFVSSSSSDVHRKPSSSSSSFSPNTKASVYFARVLHPKRGPEHMIAVWDDLLHGLSTFAKKSSSLDAACTQWVNDRWIRPIGHTLRVLYGSASAEQENVWKHIEDVLRACLCLNPQRRASASKLQSLFLPLVQHPKWFPKPVVFGKGYYPYQDESKHFGKLSSSTLSKEGVVLPLSPAFSFRPRSWQRMEDLYATIRRESSFLHRGMSASLSEAFGTCSWSVYSKWYRRSFVQMRARALTETFLFLTHPCLSQDECFASLRSIVFVHASVLFDICWMRKTCSSSSSSSSSSVWKNTHAWNVQMMAAVCVAVAFRKVRSDEVLVNAQLLEMMKYTHTSMETMQWYERWALDALLYAFAYTRFPLLCFQELQSIRDWNRLACIVQLVPKMACVCSWSTLLARLESSFVSLSSSSSSSSSSQNYDRSFVSNLKQHELTELLSRVQQAHVSYAMKRSIRNDDDQGPTLLTPLELEYLVFSSWPVSIRKSSSSSKE